MLRSVLLYMEEAKRAAPVIQLAVSLARETEARVRGMTLVDTRALDEALDSESAMYVSMAHTHTAVSEHTHSGARAELSRACLHASLNFDVRGFCGNPLEILPTEARFHDLVVASAEIFERQFPATLYSTLSPDDISELVKRGVQPLMLLPSSVTEIRRVLLIYDGSEAAGRAIRSYFNLGVLRGADHRLLSFGRKESEAKASLSEMADYCLSHCRSLETGYAVGRPSRRLAAYAAKWQPDLVVLGIERKRGLVTRLMGRATIDLLKTLNCGMLVQA